MNARGHRARESDGSMCVSSLRENGGKPEHSCNITYERSIDRALYRATRRSRRRKEQRSPLKRGRDLRTVCHVASCIPPEFIRLVLYVSRGVAWRDAREDARHRVERGIYNAFLPSGWLRARDVIHSSAYYAIQDTAVSLRLSLSLSLSSPFSLQSAALFLSLFLVCSLACSLARAPSRPLNARRPLGSPPTPFTAASRRVAARPPSSVLIVRRRRRVLARLGEKTDRRKKRESDARPDSRGTNAVWFSPLSPRPITLSVCTRDVPRRPSIIQRVSRVSRREVNVSRKRLARIRHLRSPLNAP